MQTMSIKTILFILIGLLGLVSSVLSYFTINELEQEVFKDTNPKKKIKTYSTVNFFKGVVLIGISFYFLFKVRRSPAFSF
jgi:predicted cation transporter